jgi:hypothetical protein
MRTTLVALVVAAGLGIPGSGEPTSMPDPPDAAASDFEGDWERIRSLMDRGCWERAHDALLEALERHSGRDYVRSRRAEVENAMEQCLFHAEYGVPTLDELTSGEVLSWRESSGILDIRYRWDGLDDFEKVEGGRVHPAVFDGDYTIRLEVSYLRANFTVVLHSGADSFLRVEFANRVGRTGTVRLTLFRIRNDRALRLPCKVDVIQGVDLDTKGSNRYEIQVSRRTVRVAIRGRAAARASLSGHWFDHVVFDENALSGTVRLRGRVETGWARMLADRHLQRERDRFRKEFAPAEHLPAWLYETDPEPLPEYAVAPSVALQRVLELIEPPRSASLGLALIASPAAPRPYVRIAEALLALGEFDAAERVIEEAERRGVTSEEIRGFRGRILRASRGPDWTRRYEAKSRHYHVMSEIDTKTCREVARILEEGYLGYCYHLKRIRDLERRRFRVLVFSGPASFASYVGDRGGWAPKGAVGIYDTNLKQLLITMLPDEEKTLQVARHEGFHQYLDRLIDEAPTWFNEGLAQYYELARRVGGKWTEGQVNPTRLAILHANSKKAVSLEKLLAMEPAEFYGSRHVAVRYAQSWAFVHYLRHSTEANEQLFEDFFEALCEGMSGPEAADRVFGRVDLYSLQRGFWRHVQTLR